MHIWRIVALLEGRSRSLLQILLPWTLSWLHVQSVRWRRGGEQLHVLLGVAALLRVSSLQWRLALLFLGSLSAQRGLRRRRHRRLPVLPLN